MLPVLVTCQPLTAFIWCLAREGEQSTLPRGTDAVSILLGAAGASRSRAARSPAPSLFLAPLVPRASSPRGDPFPSVPPSPLPQAGFGPALEGRSGAVPLPPRLGQPGEGNLPTAAPQQWLAGSVPRSLIYHSLLELTLVSVSPLYPGLVRSWLVRGCSPCPPRAAFPWQRGKTFLQLVRVTATLCCFFFFLLLL